MQYTVYSECQGKDHHADLRFQSEVIPSRAENYTFLEKPAPGMLLSPNREKMFDGKIPSDRASRNILHILFLVLFDPQSQKGK